jgi:hypothetical protein
VYGSAGPRSLDGLLGGRWDLTAPALVTVLPDVVGRPAAGFFAAFLELAFFFVGRFMVRNLPHPSNASQMAAQ